MYFSDEIIEVCPKCHGIRECWCQKDKEDKKYIKVVRWIYDLAKNLNPV